MTDNSADILQRHSERMNRDGVEKAARALDITAPRISAEDAEALVSSADISIEEQRGHKWAIAILTLRNGYQVVGTGRPHPANDFDPIELQLARHRAIEQLRMLEGYLRHQRAFEGAPN